MDYGRQVIMNASWGEAVERVRRALAEQGFGVITEIDMRTTLREKLGEETGDYLILGACNPRLARRALAADPSVGLLLPCNVVIRADGGRVVVEALDPQVMVRVAERAELQPVADEAARGLDIALAALAGSAGESRQPATA